MSVIAPVIEIHRHNASILSFYRHVETDRHNASIINFHHHVQYHAIPSSTLGTMPYILHDACTFHSVFLLGVGILYADQMFLILERDF